jgi:hypothetical protein
MAHSLEPCQSGIWCPQDTSTAARGRGQTLRVKCNAESPLRSIVVSKRSTCNNRKRGTSQTELISRNYKECVDSSHLSGQSRRAMYLPWNARWARAGPQAASKPTSVTLYACRTKGSSGKTRNKDTSLKYSSKRAGFTHREYNSTAADPRHMSINTVKIKHFRRTWRAHRGTSRVHSHDRFGGGKGGEGGSK